MSEQKHTRREERSGPGQASQVDERQKDTNRKGEQPRPGTGSDEAQRWREEP
ncbi:hypothetical protein [Pseudomonas mangiferae]|uniref:hypothetical protein n=1 Tax=Pseudomonas mangiferae TaxID=2593654 RepID=UPI0015B5D2C5|nr:hypothetical protein [Pseudomonas mangiferae]